MGKDSKIGWTDHTLNLWIGCTKVGPGCDFCYADAMDKRWTGGKRWGPGAPRHHTADATWNAMDAWNREARDEGIRRKVFVNSLSDFMDNEVDQGWRDDAYSRMSLCEWLDFQILTKRIGNTEKMIPRDWISWPDNIWLGMTIVNQEEADRDWAKMRDLKTVYKIPTTFLSIEPQLGPINPFRLLGLRYDSQAGAWVKDSMPIVNWIINGGESGHHARDFNLSWAEQILDMCRIADVAYFLKQAGRRPVRDATAEEKAFLATQDCTPNQIAQAVAELRFNHLKGEDMLEWPEHLRVRQFPEVAHGR